ncbi:hypothetical protein OKW22_000869 [Bacilli bacterium PM5-3]|nr:hypothetical protein [Bacilli bacterium PM5-3]
MKKILSILFVCMLLFGINVDAKETKTCKTKGLTTTCYYKKSKDYKSYSKRTKVIKYKNGKKKQKEFLTKDKKGKITLNKVYRYNKKGKLKSTKKDGSATRKYYYYYSNNKISKRITWKYNKKGKLTNKKVETKKYKKNKPLTLGERIVKNGRSFLKYEMVCGAFLDETLEKTGLKYSEKKRTDEYGEYLEGAVFYKPDDYKYSTAFVIKNSTEHKYYLKVIKNKKMNSNQLKVFNDRKSLIKQLKIGDVIDYNGNAHVAIYSGNGKAIQGGLGFKTDGMGRRAGVGYAPIDLGKGYKITQFVRIHKIVND